MNKFMGILWHELGDLKIKYEELVHKNIMEEIEAMAKAKIKSLER